MPNRKLLQEWVQYRDRLGIEFVSPFVLTVDGRKLKVDLLLRNFGGPNGMLIVTDYSVIKPYTGRLEHFGYGYSVLPEPGGEMTEEDIQKAIEMFRDWGWSGPEASRPSWLDPRKA
jgi:hypothetical protein